MSDKTVAVVGAVALAVGAWLWVRRERRWRQAGALAIATLDFIRSLPLDVSR